MRIKSILAAVLTISLLAGCSSGGGGGGGQPNSSALFTLQQTTIQLEGHVGGNSPWGYATGSVDGASNDVYIFAVLSGNGVLASADIAINGTTGELSVIGANPSSLGEGVFRDTVVINVCNDNRCSSHVSGSPKTIEVQYTIGPDPAVNDSDNDGVADLYDVFPDDPNEQSDADADGVGDQADSDDDNDNVADADDDFPLDATLSAKLTRVTVEVANGTLEIDTQNGLQTCTQTCSFDIDNELSSYNVVTFLAAKHFTFVTWAGQLCTSNNGNSCTIRQPHIKAVTLTPILQEASHMVVTASSLANGGFVELAGRVQCQQDCQAKVYGDSGTRLELSPVPHAGFEFVTWGGACSGSGSCELELVPGTTVDITANFQASSAEPFVVCPGTPEATFTGSGTMAATDVGQVLPLCNGWMLYADTKLNQVVLADVVNAAISRTYQLTQKPAQMALDTKNQLLYVSHLLHSFITRIDLSTGLVSDIYVGFQGAVGMAMTDQGELFLHTNGVALMDSNSGMFFESWDSGDETIDGVITFNDATQRLMSSSQFFHFDRDAKTLTATGVNVPSYSSNCTAPVLSADGMHLSVPCGGGNGDGYDVFDHSGEDPTIVLGSWETGAYPTAVAFVSNQPYVLISNYDQALLFSIQTHAVINSFSLGRCFYRNEPNVAVASDSKLLFGVDCEFGDNSTLLRWQALQSLIN